MDFIYSRGVAPVTIQFEDESEAVFMDFGDGTSATVMSGKHEYKYPGEYILSFSGEAHKIIVDDTDILNNGLGNNENRRSYQYGNSTEQGYGWSENGDTGFVVPDNYGSVIPLYDNDDNFQMVIYDSATGLPYTDNPRKACLNSKILDSWLDKADPFKAEGYAIRTRVRLPEFTTSHESYQQQMSDLSLFFSPIYKERQGTTGYTEEGLRENSVIDIELYADDKINSKAKSVDIPMDVELFFDRDVRGNPLQVAFETSDSQYRFIKSEAFLERYDKAKFPFKNGMSDVDFQKELGNALFRLSRRIGVDVITGEGLPVTRSTGLGPDGKTSLWQLSDTITLQEGFVVVVSNQDDVILDEGTPVELTVLPVGSFFLSYGAIAEGNTVAEGSNRVFDLRVFSAPISVSAINYFISDITENFGNNTCGRL